MIDSCNIYDFMHGQKLADLKHASQLTSIVTSHMNANQR